MSLRVESARFTYIRADSKRRVVVIAKAGLEGADVTAICDRQAADGIWSYDVLYNLRAIQGVTTPTASENVSALVQRLAGEYGVPGRVAIVAREVGMPGIAQGAAHNGAQSGIDIHVFWDVSEAEQWLDSAQPLPA